MASRTGRMLLIAGLLLAVPLLFLLARPTPVDYPLATSPPLEARTASQFMVSAAHPDAVAAGLEILHAGGNAVDAAIAVQLVLGLVEPPETGIGGGGFMLLRDGKTGALHFHDGRETAPATATPDLFLLPGGLAMPLWAAVPSGRSIGVPGLMAMLEQAHREHGELPWSRLFEPAIRLAEQGFPMPERLRRQLAEDPSLRLFTDLRAQFYRPEKGDPPRLDNPRQARTLRQLAENGAGVLYHGSLAAEIVERANSARWLPSAMTERDLADYRPLKREPVCGTYRQWTLCGAPPPSSGGIALLQILGMLERFPMQEYGPDSIEGWHLIAEASRLAFADRDAWIGDPDFVAVPTEALIDPAYLTARARLIDPHRAMPAAPAGNPLSFEPVGDRVPRMEPETPGTSHLSVVDGQGNVVALTSSIEMPFGSRMMAGGFLLNNQLTDFTFQPVTRHGRHPNAVAGGKRPRSSMSPVIVIGSDGRSELVLGSRGGSRIIGHVARTLIAVLDWEMDIQDAMALPNLVHRGEALEIERGSPLAERQGDFEALGHRVRITRMTSGLHGMRYHDGVWIGGADPRLEGRVGTERCQTD